MVDNLDYAIYVDRLNGAIVGQLLGACMTGPPPSLCGMALLAYDAEMYGDPDGFVPAVAQWAEEHPLPPMVQRAMGGSPADLLASAGGSIPFNHACFITVCCGCMHDSISEKITDLLTADPLARAGAKYVRSICGRIMFGTELCTEGIPADWIDEKMSRSRSLAVSPPCHVSGAVSAAAFALACIRHAAANNRVPNFTAILCAVNARGGDAAVNRGIVGAILGSYLGFHRLPQDVIKNIMGGPEDDTPQGYIKKLVRVALQMTVYRERALPRLLRQDNPSTQPDAPAIVVVPDAPALVPTADVLVGTPDASPTSMTVSGESSDDSPDDPNEGSDDVMFSINPPLYSDPFENGKIPVVDCPESRGDTPVDESVDAPVDESVDTDDASPVDDSACVNQRDNDVDDPVEPLSADTSSGSSPSKPDDDSLDLLLRELTDASG